MAERFVVTLSETERAQLEAYRAANGLRSEAEAVRHLIAGTVRATAAVVRVTLPGSPGSRPQYTEAVEVPFGPIKRAQPKKAK